MKQSNNAIAETKSRALGYLDGVRRGDSLTDGNTTLEQYAKIRTGYEEGDCEVMDLCPYPLSGEWADESISEIFNLNIGQDYPDDELLDKYEQGFQEGFWNKVIQNCNYHLQTEEETK